MGMAGEYYAKEGEAGYWMGKGANTLGLEGNVAGKDFAALCQGYNPTTGEALMKNAGDPDRRAGWDLTFSAPKSVSVAWSIADPQTRAALEKAHGQAVEKAFAMIQDRAGYARTGAQGKHLERADLVAAAFQHGTSREQDAQLHTHVFVMNSAIREDGRAAGIASERLYEYKMAGGAAYQCALAHELKTMGYTLERDGTESFRIAAVPLALEAEQSTRRAQIEAHMKEHGTSGGRAAAVATLATRNAKGEIDLPVLQERWATEAKAHGFTPEMAKPNNTPTQQTEPKKEKAHELQRHNHTATNTKPNSIGAGRDVARLRIQTGPARDAASIGQGGQRNGRDSIARPPRSFGLPERYFGKPKTLSQTPALASVRTLNSLRVLPSSSVDDQQKRAESLLPRHAPNHLVNHGAAQPDSVRRPDTGSNAIGSTKPPLTEQISQVKPGTGLVLAKATENDAIVRDAQILMHSYRLSIGNSDTAQAEALASRAKSQAVAVERLDGERDPKGQAYTTKELMQAERDVLRSAIERQGETWHSVPREAVEAAAQRTAEAKGYQLNSEQRAALDKLCSEPGGVQVLVGDAGTGKSTTMHALREAHEAHGLTVIGTSTGGKASAVLMADAGIESRNLAKLNADIENGKTTLDDKTVIVLDEAGMTDSREMAKLTEKADEVGAKVILVGDHKQLQPVGAGETFRHVAEAIGSARLEDNQRQRNEWERGAVKEMSQGEAGAALAKYEKNDRVSIEKTHLKAVDEIAQRQVENIKEVGAEKTVAIAGTNQTVNQVNEAIREKLKEGGELQDAKTLSTQGNKGQKQEIELAQGDRVLIKAGDKDGRFTNGDTATVQKVDEKANTVTITLDRTKETIEIKASDTQLKHGYAITTHASQGSTYERATVHLTAQTSREMSYVQSSRAREETHFVTSSHQLKEMAQKVPATPEMRDAVDKIAQAREAAGKPAGAHEEAKESYAAAMKFIEKNERFAPDVAKATTEKEQLAHLAKAMSESKPKESTLDYRVRDDRNSINSREVQFGKDLEKVERAMQDRIEKDQTKEREHGLQR